MNKNPDKCGYSANGFGLHTCKLCCLPCERVKHCPLINEGESRCNDGQSSNQKNTPSGIR